jgi:hypothetical protein
LPTSGPGRISARALSYAVIACAKANQIEEAFNLIDLYSSANEKEEVITLAALNALIASCGRKRPDLAVQTLNEMQVKYRVTPDAMSYRLAIIACNQAEHREAKSMDTEPFEFTWWQCALSLLRRMQENGLKPDTQTYSSVVSALESGKPVNDVSFSPNNAFLTLAFAQSWTMAKGSWSVTINSFNVRFTRKQLPSRSHEFGCR